MASPWGWRDKVRKLGQALRQKQCMDSFDTSNVLHCRFCTWALPNRMCLAIFSMSWSSQCVPQFILFLIQQIFHEPAESSSGDMNLMVFKAISIHQWSVMEANQYGQLGSDWLSQKLSHVITWKLHYIKLSLAENLECSKCLRLPQAAQVASLRLSREYQFGLIRVLIYFWLLAKHSLIKLATNWFAKWTTPIAYQVCEKCIEMQQLGREASGALKPVTSIPPWLISASTRPVQRSDGCCLT